MRKLNPPRNLVNRNKRAESSKECRSKEESTMGDAYRRKNEIMNSAESLPIVKMPTRSRFDVLLSQETPHSQMQRHSETIDIKETIRPNCTLELIK